MTDRPAGPVKPPVIDLTARSGARPDKPAGASGAGAPQAKPRPTLATGNWPLFGGLVLGGAIVGTALTYGLALLLPLPGRAPPPDLSAEVTAQSERLDALETELGALGKSGGATQASLDAAITRLDSGLDAANQSIAALKAAMPEPATPVDLGPLEAGLRTLKAQVDAIAAGASGADAGAMAQSLADLDANVTSLATRLDGVDSTLTGLRADLDASRKALADHIASALPDEIGPALKLPLILSGLESAFATGKPFQSELDGLRAVLPDFAVPASLQSVAATGLMRPDEVEARLEAVLPDILAANDARTGEWTSDTLGWLRSLLALRPAEEMAGDSPEAIASRLEGAMARHDFVAARDLIGQLPAPMQQAAAPVATVIAAHADADTLVADLRARALASAATP